MASTSRKRLRSYDPIKDARGLESWFGRTKERLIVEYTCHRNTDIPYMPHETPEARAKIQAEGRQMGMRLSYTKSTETMIDYVQTFEEFWSMRTLVDFVPIDIGFPLSTPLRDVDADSFHFLHDPREYAKHKDHLEELRVLVELRMKTSFVEFLEQSLEKARTEGFAKH